MTLREDVAVGWEALEQWGDDVARIEPLTGGVGVNEVWSVRVNGQLAVGRLGRRSDADLAWETELLRHLDREGMTVPVPIPTTDGRHFADGLVVMTYVEGGPPETEADWRRVADTLRQLHRLTQGWPQRPGWRSSTDLLHAETGTKIDLGAMPPEGVVRCRAAWARLTGRERCVVHGDPNPRNIRMTADRVALIDWDESHVDVPDLDLVLPHNAAGLDDDAHDIAAQAWAAWEAAVCWDPSGTTSSQSSGSPKFERSEQQQRIGRSASAGSKHPQCYRKNARLVYKPAQSCPSTTPDGGRRRGDRVRHRLRQRRRRARSIPRYCLRLGNPLNLRPESGDDLMGEHVETGRAAKRRGRGSITALARKGSDVVSGGWADPNY